MDPKAPQWMLLLHDHNCGIALAQVSHIHIIRYIKVNGFSSGLDYITSGTMKKCV